MKQEHDEWLAQLVGLQVGLLKRQMLDTSSENKSNASDENSDGRKPNNETVRKPRKTKVTLEKRQALMSSKNVLKKLKQPEPKENEDNRVSHIMGKDTKEDMGSDRKGSPKPAKDTAKDDDDLSCSESMKIRIEEDASSVVAEEKKEALDDVLKDFDKAIDNEDTYSTCSSTASECSFGDVADGRELNVRAPMISSEARSEIYEYLARFRKSQGSNGYNISSFDPVLRDFLAVQRIDHLFSKQVNSGESSEHFEPHSLQSRAALVPLNNPRCREPCHIQRRSVDIGLGVSSGIDLSKVGHCNYVSTKVITIYSNKNQRHFIKIIKRRRLQVIISF